MFKILKDLSKLFNVQNLIKDLSKLFKVQNLKGFI
jgi:hypothetical protein